MHPRIASFQSGSTRRHSQAGSAQVSVFSVLHCRNAIRCNTCRCPSSKSTFLLGRSCLGGVKPNDSFLRHVRVGSLNRECRSCSSALVIGFPSSPVQMEWGGPHRLGTYGGPFPIKTTLFGVEYSIELTFSLNLILSRTRYLV